MLLDAPTHPRNQGAGGARFSHTTNVIGCRWCSSLLQVQAHKFRCCQILLWNQGPMLPMVSKALALPSTKVLMLPDAPAQPRACVAGGVQGYRMTKGPRCQTVILNGVGLGQYPNSSFGIGEGLVESFLYSGMPRQMC
ncbi:hypothetical protein GOBAR_AA09100 [Gossypium barbadense]|uniref:Uncharacterized protein n=1 Tax=Gossypium barbadense TaxID=3634 RepID=A0A2P5Y7M3_GOSBA|nr:hypothetical protein GOBAR_AA09100 [Gossypium barbadense]